jgi:leucyl aminopeptidase (aminopeptidase T)
MIGGGADCDPKVFHAIGERIRPYVEDGEGEVHCTSKLGTDLRCSVKGARNINYTGMADRPGTSGCTPDGEFEIYPVKGSANGVIVVDGPMNHVRESTGVYGNYPWDAYHKPLKLVVEEGRFVEAIGDGGDADKFRWLIENVPNADNFGEFALGTNPMCRETGEFSEEKKRLGNVHMAYGRGCTPPVDCNLHLDLVVRKPRVEIDGVPIIDKGKLLI